MGEMVKELLAKRRDRSIAIILGTKEREMDRFLPPEVSVTFRKVVLDQINDFYDLALDVLRSLDDGTVILNQEYLTKLDEIHQWVRNDDG